VRPHPLDQLRDDLLFVEVICDDDASDVQAHDRMLNAVLSPPAKRVIAL